MFFKSHSDGRTVVALVASRGQRELLLSRAVPSILRQTRLPDRLIVVVDQTKEELPEEERKILARKIQELGDSPISVTVLRNARTPRRAAGAWNTGLDQLHRDARLVARPELCFVAILDDDDEWEPEHIELCLEAAVAGDRGMVAAGLIRHERPGDDGHRHAIPQALDAREQFIHGQHIQGSNFFVRLDAMLKAGCFDEHLPSCTDRDLCIRLAALPDLRFGRIEHHTVHHYADPRPDRLSTPASAAKLQGLDHFWGKYADRFNEPARQEFIARAHRLFGWTIPEPRLTTTDIAPVSPPPRRLSFVAGFVTDAEPRGHVRGLLDDLLGLASDPGVSRLAVVVVENGPVPDGSVRPLHSLAEEYRHRGLELHLVTIEQQREDWAQGTLIDCPDPAQNRLPIAVTRTVLNTYLVRVADKWPDACAWILDDDKRLNIQVDCGDGRTVNRPSPDLAALCALRDAGVDVVIGPDTDAAPLPFTATLRVQLVDMEHQLRVLGATVPEAVLPDRAAGESLVRASLADSYYDLSRHTEHLETPFSLPPIAARSSARATLAFLGDHIDRLLAGEALFRPLRIAAEAVSRPHGAASVQRGGSAIFFDTRVLLEYPHTLARVGDRYVRRSDMLVSQLMRDQLGLNIVMHAAAGVRHDRTFTTQARLEDRTLWEDVLGYALYRAANEVMQARHPELRRKPLLAWHPHELDRAVRLVRKYIAERLAAFTLNAWRIVGLAETIRRVATQMTDTDSPWSAADCVDHLDRIRSEMDRICGNFKPAAVSEFAARIRRSVTDADIRAAFSSMDGVISEYRATRARPAGADTALEASRELRARALLKRAYGIKDLRLLGSGGEGIVFTDELKVIKVLDLLKKRPNHDTIGTLRAYSDRFEQATHLYPLHRVEIRDGTLVVVYPYEPSEPYTGGHGGELIALLRECKRYGIVFRNMHPKNLRVSPSGLKLVDYGSDVRPLSDAGYRTMAERAWLSWRWAHRPDLDQLMRRALVERALPELDGFARFWAALTDEQPSATRTVAAVVDPLVLDSPSRRVLDYGCGKKARSARRLSEAGLEVVGFDPGADMPDRWRALGPHPSTLTLTTDRAAALANTPFDAVICSLVLCELEDGPEYEQTLADIRAALQDQGIAIVTVCNPSATFGGPTPLHRRRDLPPGVNYQDSFWYTENAETGAGRREFHRPLSRLERDLLRHGLRVERCIESRTVDLERFEPASDFISLVCRPILVETPNPRVSLLIKTCAMEASTIERQVTHLVTQLEGPRAFYERVLAIDPLPEGFARQYTPADLDGLHHAADRLVRRGIIDRAIVGPDPGTDSCRVLRDWFGIDSECTHSLRGAPLVTPLLAFERCQGDYILQVDSDLFIVRTDHGHDYLGEMMKAIDASPAAITASLNVLSTEHLPFTTGGEDGPWRVEARGCLFHTERLLAARPFPNRLDGSTPRLSWHRSMDLAAASGRIQSLRGGSRDLAFVHPPNELKRSCSDWMLLLDLAEKGHFPPAQAGSVELVGGPLQWVPRNRDEPFVFVITGRDVSQGRALRCLESLATQERTDWGAVLIDDGSSVLARTALARAAEPWRDRVTLIQPRERRGQLANLTLAIRHICTNPDSVIITLDLDDALIGASVLDRLNAEYARGADVTVGTMLRTDKHAEYPVTLDSPRRARGGNVWQHLRSFRKQLFDAIPDQDLRVNGRYTGIAVDWAFMLPIVEMAQRPVWIREPLYLYEPSGMGKGEDRHEREEQIAAIVAKRPRPSRAFSRSLDLLDPKHLSREIWDSAGGILFIRHGERPSFTGLTRAERDGVKLTNAGRLEASQLGKVLGPGGLVVSSPVLRAVETAEAIAKASGIDCADLPEIGALVRFREADRGAYAAVKRRLGWAGLMMAWMDGSLPPGTLIPCHDVARSAISETLAAGMAAGRSRVIAVTHDFMIMALMASIGGTRTTSIPYLGGVLVELEDAHTIRQRGFTS